MKENKKVLANDQRTMLIETEYEGCKSYEVWELKHVFIINKKHPHPLEA